MVSQEDVEKARKSGRAAGLAAARKKTNKPKKRRAKVYKIQRPDKLLKKAIGKAQHKHPLIATLVSVPIVLGGVDGAVQGLTGTPLSRMAGLGPSVENKIPWVGKIRGVVSTLVQKGKRGLGV